MTKVSGNEYKFQTNNQDSGRSFAGNPFLGKWLASNLDNDQTTKEIIVASVKEPRIPQITTTPSPPRVLQTTAVPRIQNVPSVFEAKDGGNKRPQTIDFSDVDDTPKLESNLVKSPFADICGKSVITNSLVVHGEPVARGAFPWLVAMFLLKNLGPEFRCSGSLISHKHVVTGKSPKNGN